MVKFRPFPALLVAGLTLAAAGADAQITKRGQGYQFRMNFKKGSKIQFLINSAVQMPSAAQPGATPSAPSKMLVSLTATQAIKDVKGQIATIDYTISPPMLNGQPFGNQPPTTTTLKMDTQGNVTGGEAPQGVNAKYPQKPLRIGESWKANMPFNSPMGRGKTQLVSTYKFLGIKTVDRKQVAELAVTTVSSNANGPSGGGKMLLLLSDGMLYRADMKMTMKMPAGKTEAGSKTQSPPMIIDVSMRRG